MLTGKHLGAAIKAAIQIKGVKQTEVARHFGVKPPSVQDWIRRGTIDKSKLPELWAYFGDVVGPDHWGLSAWPSPPKVAEPVMAYGPKVAPLPKPSSRIQADLMALIDAMNETGLAILLGSAREIVKQYPKAKQNPAN